MNNQPTTQSTESKSATQWVVTKPSGVHFGVCLLGEGATRDAAIEDAYGPKQNWSPQTRKQIKSADIYETDEEFSQY